MNSSTSFLGLKSWSSCVYMCVECWNFLWSIALKSVKVVLGFACWMLGKKTIMFSQMVKNGVIYHGRTGETSPGQTKWNTTLKGWTGIVKYNTNPNNMIVWGKPFKITKYMQCLIPPKWGTLRNDPSVCASQVHSLDTVESFLSFRISRYFFWV